MASLDKRVTYRRLTILIAVFVLAMILACGSGQVSPSDPILQPPLVNIGINMDEFLEWIGLFPENVIPPPWIVKPPTSYFMEQDSFRVEGFAISSEDRQAVPLSHPIVTLYEVDYPVNPSEVRELDWQEVGDDRKWAIDDVQMKDDRMVIAAKVSIVLPGGLRQYSDFSNVITVHRGKPPAPSIESPEDGFETTEETIAVKGKGHAGYSIVLFRNDVEVQKVTADGNSKWEISNVPLLAGDNRLLAKIEGTDVKSKIVVVKRKVPQPDFKFPWAEGEARYWTGGPHARGCGSCVMTADALSGLDFSGRWKVYAAASGTIVRAEWFDKTSGKGVEIDHGDGWGTQYIHLEEISPKIKEMKGKWIPRGTYLGISGHTGDGVSSDHLHLELLRNGKPETWVGKVIDGWTVHAMGIKGQEGEFLNYQGSMTRGEESIKEAEWCNTPIALVTIGEQTRVADSPHKKCNQDPSQNNEVSSSCNQLISSNRLPENE